MKASHKLMNVGLAVAFATSLGIATSASAFAQSNHNRVTHNGFHPGIPACGSPYKCFNYSGLEGLGVGANWVNNLDPVQVTDVTSGVFDNMMYGQLVQLLPQQSASRSATNANGWVAPNIASSVDLSGNQKDWTFHLRAGEKFANGDPITPFDVKWSIARAAMGSMASYVTDYYDGLIQNIGALNGDTTISAAMSDLTGVDFNTGADTVTIHATAVAPYFLESLTYPTTSILNPGCPGGCNSLSDLSSANHGMSLAGSGEYTGGGGSGHPEFLDSNCEAAQESASQALMPACVGTGSGSGNPGEGSYYPTGTTPTLTMIPNPNWHGTAANYEMRSPLVATSDQGYASYNAHTGPDALDVTGIPSQFIAKLEKQCSKSKENKDGTAVPKACPGKKGSSFARNATSVMQYFTPNMIQFFHGSSGAGSPFHSLNCRLVFVNGVNTAAIVKVLHNTVQAAKTVLPPNIGGSLGLKGKGGVPGGYNPKAAEKHVAPCLKDLKKYGNFGHPTKLTFTMTYPTGSQDAFNEQATIQHYLNKIKGVHETLKGIDANTWYGYASQDENNNNLAILSNGWQEDFPDGFDYETLLLGAGQNYNIGNWESPFLATSAEKTQVTKYNTLVNEAATSFNQSQRNSWYQQAGEIALKQVAWVTRFNALGFALQRSTISGFIGTPQYGELVPVGDDWSNIHVS